MAEPTAGRVERVLRWVERTGDRLPDPATLFGVLAGLVVGVSVIGAAAGWSVKHPGDGSDVVVKSLLEPDAARRLLTDAVANFAGFPPLGVVLVTLLGIGVAEGSGLFDALLRAAIVSVPRRWLTPMFLFAGINASIAADAGFLVLCPLGAAAFLGAGRHPLAGVALAYAAISGGFSANLLITGLDPLLAGLTTSAARLVDPAYTVDATANWYLMAVSVFLLTAVGTVVNDRFVEPRLGPWTGAAVDEAAPSPVDPSAERRGLWGAAAAGLLWAAAVAALAGPEGALLRDADGGLAPLFKALVPLLAIGFFAVGVGFGVGAGTIRSDRDVVRMASAAMSTMGSYLVLAFFAAQFLAWFNASNLGVVLAVNGATALASVGLGSTALLAGFIALAASLNLMIASASAKWAVMAPVFVPMLMLLGVSPEVTQAAYRVADSCTNPISPLMPYLPIALLYARRYVPQAGVGTMMTLLLPYSLAFLASWVPVFLVWAWLGLPMGPGAPSTWAP